MTTISATPPVTTPADTGAAWLDEHEPDWLEYVNPDRLDMSRGELDPSDRDSCGCILAQLHPNGSYSLYLADHGLSHTQAQAYGFTLNGLDEHHAWPALTAHWRRILDQRAHSTP